MHLIPFSLSVKGFNESEGACELRYITLFGDSDSSLLVRNVGCANHAVNCYTLKLLTLPKDSKGFSGKKGTWGMQTALGFEHFNLEVPSKSHHQASFWGVMRKGNNWSGKRTEAPAEEWIISSFRNGWKGLFRCMPCQRTNSCRCQV